MSNADPLRAWVLAHRVCWEVDIHREQAQAGTVPVGFDVHLYARVDRLAEGPAVRGTLREVAAAVIPPEAPETRCGVAPDEASFVSRPAAAGALEVRVRVRIEHRHGTWEGVDAAETAAVAHIESALLALGCQYESWNELLTPRPAQAA